MLDSLSKLLMYIPGIVVFLVGSGQVRTLLRRRRSDFCVSGQVVSCKHVVKKDKKDREIYNYYDVLVSYVNPHTMHQERLAVKSPTEYSVGQQVEMYKDRSGEKPVLAEYSDESLFHPIVTTLNGALLILLALAENKGQDTRALLCLVLVFILAGGNMLISYIQLKKKALTPVEAEITGTFKRQISKETKILRGSRFTYYPVVRYTIDGQENTRRCLINSSDEKAFKTGETLTLYYDPKTKTILEKNAKLITAIAGAALLIIGLISVISLLMSYPL